jgi:hypothetical protein
MEIFLAGRPRNSPGKNSGKISGRIEKKSLREKIGARIMRSTQRMAFELRSSSAPFTALG